MQTITKDVVIIAQHTAIGMLLAQYMALRIQLLTSDMAVGVLCADLPAQCIVITAAMDDAMAAIIGQKDVGAFIEGIVAIARHPSTAARIATTEDIAPAVAGHVDGRLIRS